MHIQYNGVSSTIVIVFLWLRSGRSDQNNPPLYLWIMTGNNKMIFLSLLIRLRWGRARVMMLIVTRRFRVFSETNNRKDKLEVCLLQRALIKDFNTLNCISWLARIRDLQLSWFVPKQHSLKLKTSWTLGQPSPLNPLELFHNI